MIKIYMNSVGILIPTYNPEPALLNLIQEVQAFLPENLIFLMRDGRRGLDNGLFETVRKMSNVIVVEHAVNLGKGRALKTAFNEILVKYPEVSGVVTADADGQHRPKDIHEIAKLLGHSIILGSRFQGNQTIPMKSRIGNNLTRFVFRVFVGLKLKDTQTGLRGLPRHLLSEMLCIAGERYEYETNVLIHAKQKSWLIQEIDIETVYIDQNRGSHFNPILDSMRIYFLIFRFLFSSLSTSLIDLAVFTFLISLNMPIMGSVAGSRLVAGVYNFSVNKNIVFRSGSSNWFVMFKYWSLVLALATLSYLGTTSLFRFGINVYASKVLVELGLFVFSFTLQRDFVFNGRKEVQ